MRALGLPLTRCLGCDRPKHESLACMTCRQQASLAPVDALTREQAEGVYQILVEDLAAEPDQHESCAATFARACDQYQFTAWYRQVQSEVLTLGLLLDGTIAVVYLGTLLPEQEALVGYANRRIDAYLNGRETWRPAPPLRPGALAAERICA